MPRNRLDNDTHITVNLTWRVLNGNIEIDYYTQGAIGGNATMGAYYGDYFFNLRVGDAVIFYAANYCSENCAKVVSNDTVNRKLVITRPYSGTSPNSGPTTYRTNGQIYFVTLGGATHNVRSACYSIGKDAIVLNFESDIPDLGPSPWDVVKFQITSSYGAWGTTTYNPPALVSETILAAKGAVFNTWNNEYYAAVPRSAMFRLDNVQPRYGMINITKV